jgi:hypothetical protein
MSDLSNINPLIKSFLEKLEDNKQYTYFELSKIAASIQNKGRAKKVKDPNAPKKEKSAYQLFVAEQFPIIKAMDEHKDKQPNEVMKVIATLWKQSKNNDSPASSDSEEEHKSSPVEESKSAEKKTESNKEAAKPVEKKTRARKTKAESSE